MVKPEIPIQVDPATGVWSTDGLPMIYMPRHFFVNNHLAVEAVLGEAVYARQLYDAGHKSAWVWCETEAATHGLEGLEVFHHYMQRISQRGWGLFTVVFVDRESGAADVRLDHSVFVEHCGTDTGRKLCYMYAGWFAGLLEWAGQATGRGFTLTSREALCRASGAEHCLFEVRPA